MVRNRSWPAVSCQERWVRKIKQNLSFSTHPDAKLDLLAVDLEFVHLYCPIQHARSIPKDIWTRWGYNILTRKSTPIVAVASSSGSHCSSLKRSRRLLLPTLELPMRRSLTLMAEVSFLAFALDFASDIFVEFLRCLVDISMR